MAVAKSIRNAAFNDALTASTGRRPDRRRQVHDPFIGGVPAQDGKTVTTADAIVDTDFAWLDAAEALTSRRGTRP